VINLSSRRDEEGRFLRAWWRRPAAAEASAKKNGDEKEGKKRPKARPASKVPSLDLQAITRPPPGHHHSTTTTKKLDMQTKRASLSLLSLPLSLFLLSSLSRV